jgi:hypothetical protein
MRSRCPGRHANMNSLPLSGLPRDKVAGRLGYLFLVSDRLFNRCALQVAHHVAKFPERQAGQFSTENVAAHANLDVIGQVFNEHVPLNGHRGGRAMPSAAPTDERHEQDQ